MELMPIGIAKSEYAFLYDKAKSHHDYFIRDGGESMEACDVLILLHINTALGVNSCAMVGFRGAMSFFSFLELEMYKFWYLAII